MATFARFAKAVARRYGRRGTLWKQHPEVPRNPITAYQIWNEPNLKIYWCNRRPNAARYVAMLRTVGRAIKGVDRERPHRHSRHPAQQAERAPSRSSVTWPRCIARGDGRYFDSLAINSYARNQGELRGLLRSVRRLMNRHGDRRGQLWITEIGWGDRGPKHRLIVGAPAQARRITQAFGLIRHAAAPR